MDKLTASEAVYGFVAWLTTRTERTVMSASDDAALPCDLVSTFCDENDLSDPRQDWAENLVHPSGECSAGTSSGFPVVTPADAVGALKQAFQDDPDYAHSWHCNLAMMFSDAMETGGVSRRHAGGSINHEVANDAASRFMKLAFDVVTKQ